MFGHCIELRATHTSLAAFLYWDMDLNLMSISDDIVYLKNTDIIISHPNMQGIPGSSLNIDYVDEKIEQLFEQYRNAEKEQKLERIRRMKREINKDFSSIY